MTHRMLPVNGIDMHVAEAGEGPLVLLCHGWPELAYSWRHQIPALADAGFRVAAPDMRGFGKTSAPPDVASYSILHLVGDMVALVSALGEKQAVIVGHDWGAPVAWACAMLRPDLFRAVAAMSVPHRRRGKAHPIATLKAAGRGDYYWVYFQEPGIAEAELERDVASTIRRILYSGSGDTPRDHKMRMYAGASGLLGSAVDPEVLPPWLTDADLAVFVEEYRRTGFRGGLNWYRNLDRNWELLAPWHDAVVRQPALFIAGTRDAVIAGSMGQRALADMPSSVVNLKRTLLIEGAGHWVQQERPAEVNAALLAFLAEVR